VAYRRTRDLHQSAWFEVGGHVTLFYIYEPDINSLMTAQLRYPSIITITMIIIILSAPKTKHVPANFLTLTTV